MYFNMFFFIYHLSVFENKDKIVIVMEYASKGELYDYISERRRLSERETRHFFRQIVSAVHHCHKVRNNIPLAFLLTETQNIHLLVKLHVFCLSHAHLSLVFWVLL